jgi:hypothetical protein
MAKAHARPQRRELWKMDKAVMNNLHQVGIRMVVEHCVDGRDGVTTEGCCCAVSDDGMECGNRKRDSEKLEHRNWDFERPRNVGLKERDAEATAVAKSPNDRTRGPRGGGVGGDDVFDSRRRRGLASRKVGGGEDGGGGDARL